MNKMLKLPLFLGACGLACAGLLAGVNAATKGDIQDYKDSKIQEEYVNIFSTNGYSIIKEQLKIETAVEVSDGVYNVGCTGRALAVEIKGAAYTCKVQGYSDNTPVEFQIAFAEGKYLGYTNINNKETSGYGADLIASLTSLIKGNSSQDSIFANDGYVGAMTGVSKTGKPVADAIEACRIDYNSIDWTKVGGAENEEK